MAPPPAPGFGGISGAAGEGLGASRSDDLGSTHTGTSPSGGLFAGGGGGQPPPVQPGLGSTRAREAARERACARAGGGPSARAAGRGHV